MAFRFALESVLKHRKVLEDLAQREYVLARAAADEVLGRLNDMYRRLDELRAEIASAQQAATGARIEEIRAMEQFLAGHLVRIENVRAEARDLLSKAEDKQHDLIVRAQEKKVLQKLKEKRWAEYKERIRFAESKALDDQTMVRYRPGGMRK